MKRCCPHNPDLGLLLLRLALGSVFVVHGYLKLTNLEMTTGFMTSLGLPSFMGWLVGLVEMLGGLAVLAGAYTCIAGGLLALVMIGAIALVKGKLGFVGGYEYELVLLLLALGVAMLGPGKYAVCAKMFQAGEKKDECGACQV